VLVKAESGDKVRLKAGTHAGERGFLEAFDGDKLVIRLEESGAKIRVTSDEITNFSLAARKAWATEPDRAVGRRKGTKLYDRVSVTLRLDRDVWERFLGLEEDGVIGDRTRMINGWFREKLADLEGVSAISAHVRMGTYELPDTDRVIAAENDNSEVPGRTSNLLRKLQQLEGASGRETKISPILLGSDAETGEAVWWNPDPGSGSANPHVLIIGESGFGKTYTIASLSAELARENLVSIIFDYGQGFSPAVGVHST
jgi:hypothetical protein